MFLIIIISVYNVVKPRDSLTGNETASHYQKQQAEEIDPRSITIEYSEIPVQPNFELEQTA